MPRTSWSIPNSSRAASSIGPALSGGRIGGRRRLRHGRCARLQLLQDRLERKQPGGQRITVGIDRFLHEPQQRGSLFVGKLKGRHSGDMGSRSRRGGAWAALDPISAVLLRGSAIIRFIAGARVVESPRRRRSREPQDRRRRVRQSLKSSYRVGRFPRSLQ